MKKKLWLSIGILVGAVAVVGVSFAYWYYAFMQKDENVLITDCFQMSFVEEDGSDIYLEKGYPMTEGEALGYRPYHFKIKNICNSVNEYQINMESMESSTMPDRVMAVKLNQDERVLLREEVEPTVGEHAYVLEEGVIYPDETKEYDVWVWMDESTMMDDDASNKRFVGKITITTTYIKNYSEKILDGNDPVIKEPLIPVTITNEEGQNVVRKADLTSDWYRYSDHRWANAVILKDEQQEKQINEVITEDEIESYFVWIPKFDYVIFSTTDYPEVTSVNSGWNASEHAIQIRFSSKSTTDTDNECKSPNKSGDIGTCIVGKWMTHPAFVDGFEGIRGMWVGKFETGYQGSTSKETAERNETNSNAIQIKPNVNSWRSVQVANAFYSTYGYQRNLDSHMMKNTEWGAIAYLTQSIYGRCSSLTSCSEVRINNNSDYLTGYAAIQTPTCGWIGQNRDCNEYGIGIDATRPWNDTTTLGLVSTTGNVTGIYDMSGNAWEYVMGVMVSKDGKLVSGRESANNYHSNFNGMFTYPSGTQDAFTTGVNYPEDSKYYDLYNYAEDDETFGRMILGDATGEMGPFGTIENRTRKIGTWHSDEAWFVWHSKPWFDRGGSFHIGIGSGVFTFGAEQGQVNNNVSFRVVLSP